MFIKSLMKRIAIQRMVIIIKTRKRNTTKHNKTQQNATQHNAHRFLRVFPFLDALDDQGEHLSIQSDDHDVRFKTVL